MKYKVGDRVFIKKIYIFPMLVFLLRSIFHLAPRRNRIRPFPRLYVENTLGTITATEQHSNIFIDSTESDNGYVWCSDLDNKEYYLYEDEFEGLVIS